MLEIVIQTFTLFFLAIIVWSIQSFLILYISRKYIFPVLYKNKITEWFFAQVSIIIHELSHFLTAIFTGSIVDLRESYATPYSGRVAAAHEESIFGWFSALFAAVAPSFIPPIIVLFTYFLFTQQVFFDSSILRYTKTAEETVNLFLFGINEIFLPNFLSFLSAITNITNPTSWFLIYLLIVCSIAAGPSEGDWKSTLSIFLSPVPAVTLFFFFFFFSFVFSKFNYGFLIPFSILILFLFSVVLIGNIIGLIFSLILKFLFWGKR